MASVNKVIIVGNLGQDPKMRTFPNGDQITNVSIATTDKWRDKSSGEMRNATEWHNVVFTGRLAEIVGKFLRKGSQIYVEGSLRTRKWQEQNGQERNITEIRADAMQMLGRNGEEGKPSEPQQAPQQPQRQQALQSQRKPQRASRKPNAYASAKNGDDQPHADFGLMDDDIPF